jgi:4-amino-4-deoxy-L-arabinose transferase-like glycosyltransferase
MSSSLITLPRQRRPESLAAPAAPPVETPQHRSGGRGVTAVLLHPAPWLGLIVVAQYVFTRVTESVRTSFEDEGLYVYMGHRMLDHFLHGAFLQEFPGSYFSGAPGVYPVLAALADDVGGLQAVRDLSLLFVMVSTVAVYGTGSTLFGRLAGVLGAAVFAVCGSVVYQSQWATFDAMTMMLLTLAAWLAVWSGRRDGLLWAPGVAALLGLAVLTKYAGMAYVPFVIALSVTEGWPARRWVVVRRGIFTACATAAAVYFILMLWGRDLLPGIAQTTTSRSIIQPTGRLELLRDVAEWAGPWMLLILLGGLLVGWRERHRLPTALVLLGALVVGPAQQVHIGELTSLAKHLAFGIALAAPLAGYLLAWVLTRRRWWATALAAVPVLAVVAGLASVGLADASSFRTGYPDDTRLVKVLRTLVAANPGRPIMGEKSSPQRYELREITDPKQWNDTYQFSHAGLSGAAALRSAVQDHYFGVIYLSFSTPNANVIADNLGSAQVNGHYYNLLAKVPRYVRGERAGDWLVWAPQKTPLTPID